MILINLVYRAINYVAAPFIYKAMSAGEKSLRAITPEQWQKVLMVVRQTLRPWFVVMDLLRLNLARAYVHDGRCIKALKREQNAVASIVYDHKDLAPIAPPPTSALTSANSTAKLDSWTANDAKNKKTVMPLFAVLLVLSPVFLATDQLRSWLVKAASPQLQPDLEDHLESVWTYTFGGSPQF